MAQSSSSDRVDSFHKSVHHIAQLNGLGTQCFLVNYAVHLNSFTFTLFYLGTQLGCDFFALTRHGRSCIRCESTEFVPFKLIFPTASDTWSKTISPIVVPFIISSSSSYQAAPVYSKTNHWLPAKELTVVPFLRRLCSSYAIEWKLISWQVFDYLHHCIFGWWAYLVEILHFFRPNFCDFDEALFYKINVWERFAMLGNEFRDLIARCCSIFLYLFSTKKLLMILKAGCQLLGFLFGTCVRCVALMLGLTELTDILLLHLGKIFIANQRDTLSVDFFK